jgi:predicted RNA binding protein YcfA (HicA-like mRNA interferase family)
MARPGFPASSTVDFHGKKEVPSGTLNKIIKDAQIKR